MKRIAVLPDTHIPAHHGPAVSALLGFIEATQPDEIVHTGDLMDYPQPSRWTLGTRAQFAGSVKDDSRRGRRFLEALRARHEGPITLIGGNHDTRPQAKLLSAAPELAEGDEFHPRTLLDLDAYGVDYVDGFHSIAPGWVATHGHLDLPLSRIAGRTAANAATRLRTNVVMGHTHRLGLIPESGGYNGRLTTYWGLEVGHISDIRKAGYLKSGAANWQLGFGLLYVDGAQVTPHAVRIGNDGRFACEGRVWKPTGIRI